MSKLEDYLMKEYPYKIEKLLIEDGGGYFITYLDLPGCMSDGDTLEEAIRMGEDARISWIENAIDIGKDIPEPNSHMDNYKGRITVRVPKIMHKELIDEAKEEGISLNQYMIYLIAKGMKVKESNSDNL
ncbi:MAG: toxin-antitoxin system HicB family antitoxin [Clostridiales bacterium]|nr:toxin-antitoxin system HicB family antitoxin [Clostridiales bacterium]